MKNTLVVVSALVALAIAAPALPGDGFENTDRTQDWNIQTQSSLTDNLKRERKSPSEISTELQNAYIDAGVSMPMGRSFAFKKPLIVKKKFGYQVYRDSDEEKAYADVNEKCGRQVKVKLCDEDDKLMTSVTGSAHEDSEIHNTEDDVKHSIKMAKEAVENLQKDLMKMETNSKIPKESQSDAELREDIETARQALKHIHENFGTLESMSLVATTTRNSEGLHDVHATIGNTEEERMLQWKDALENIQKNYEIARNIEDSFKVADSMLMLDQSKAATTLADKKTEENMHSHVASSANNLRLAQDDIIHNISHDIEQIVMDKERTEDLSKNNATMRQYIEDDMNTAPSEMIEVHLDNIKSQEPLISENQKIIEHEKSAEAKLEELNVHTESKDLSNKDNIIENHQGSDINMNMSESQSEQQAKKILLNKAERTETKLEVENHTAVKTSESDAVTPVKTNTKVSSTSDALSKHQKSAQYLAVEDEIENHKKLEKSTDDDLIDFLAKSADTVQQKTEKEDLHKERLMKLAKAANWEMKSKENVETKYLDSIPKSTGELENTHFHNLGEHKENVMLAKSVDHTSVLDHQKQQMMQHRVLSAMETVPEMKSAQEHLHHLQHMHNAHWAHENRHSDHLSSMRTDDNEFHMAHGQAHGQDMLPEHTMDHLRNSHMTEHQIPSKMGLSHNFEKSNHVQAHHNHHHHHQPSRYHHNAMTHSQMNDMGGMGHSNFRPSMRDAMEGYGSNHMFHWKSAQESARSAYGSGSTGGTGAVGVFPNANVGGCSIPLLLSCSPSVVSGSLAKSAHSAGPSSYSSPSYRMEEDFAIHNKRDTKKTTDMRSGNVLRSPTNVQQKNSMALENKM